jgi:A/G-specific adenine glycosylase
VTPGLRIHPGRRDAFVRRLLDWYAHNHRLLPWRRTKNPYHILVAEIMLQQTQVSRVVPKYREFLRAYPSLDKLARASTREVRELWYPLGYNIRPRRLRDIARTAVRRYGGRLPSTRGELLSMKGIGPYTAGAVLTFAFGSATPIVDTNVRRVLRRVFFAGERAPDATLWQLSGALLPERDGYDFNQAIMELGATVCTARSPACPSCPVRALCRAAPSFKGRREGPPEGRRQ